MTSNGTATGPTRDSNTLESLIDSLSPTSSTISSSPIRSGFNGVDNLEADTVQAVRGLIYLSAGTQIAFSGYFDDSLFISLGGTTLLQSYGDAWGQYDTSVNSAASANWGNFTTSGTYTVAVSGYYTFEMYAYNHYGFNGNGAGDISINVTINGVTTALSSSNLSLYPDITTVDSAGGVHQDFVMVSSVGNTDGGFYPAQVNVGIEGQEITLSSVKVALTDTDGSEHISSIVISNIPQGMTITDGTHTFTATSSSTSAVVTDWNLDNLVVTPPVTTSSGASTTYTLIVTATSQEGNDTHNTASSSAELQVTVLDSAPTTYDSSAGLVVGVDTIHLFNYQAGFVNAVYNNAAHTSFDNNKYKEMDGNDNLKDLVFWGTSNNGYQLTSTTGSSYYLNDNSELKGSTGISITTGDSIYLGKFIHTNQEISGDSLHSVSIEVVFDLVVDGQQQPVTIDIPLTHNETPNTSDASASRDIISIGQTSFDIQIGSRTFTLSLDGFSTSNSSSAGASTTVYTTEGQANTFYLYGSIQPKELPSISGHVDFDAGSDGSTSGVVWASHTSDYGTFIGYADGTYTFTLNDSTRDTILVGQKYVETYTYSVTDSDGDVSSSTLTINIGGYNEIDGNSSDNTSLSGSSSDDLIRGFAGNDVLTGSSGNDYLDGGSGNDELKGGVGQDTLVGGLGEDILTGGGDHDIFKWTASDVGTSKVHQTDTITDFSISQGDQLDLKDVLSGSNSLDKYLSFGTSGNDAVVSVHAANSNDTTLSIVMTGHASDLDQLKTYLLNGSGVIH